MSDILKIQISADTKQAEVALESTQKKLAGVAAAAVKADSSLDGLAKSVAPAAVGINKAGAASGGASQKIGALASSVSQSVSGFEELGALANVAELGLAGLGAVAISAAIAFVEYVTKLSNAAQAQRDLSISLNESAASVQGNVARLEILVGIAKDVTKSDAERKEALGALNKEYDGFNKSLTLANINTEAATELINKQTAAIVRQAQIKGLENLITKESEKQADLLNAKIEDRLSLLDKVRALGSFDAFSATVKFNNTNLKNGLDDSKERVKIFKDELANLLNQDLIGGGTPITGIIGKLREKIKELQDVQPTLLSEAAISDNVSQIKKLQDELDRLLGKTKKSAETVGSTLAKLARQIALLNQQEIDLGADEAKAKISAIEQTIQRLVKDFKVDPKSTIIQKLFGDIRDLQPLFDRVANINVKVKSSTDIKEQIDKDYKEAQNELGKNPLVVKVKTGIQITTPDSAEKANLDKALANILNSAPSSVSRQIDFSVKTGDIKPVIEYANKVNDAFNSIAQSAALLQSDIFVAIGKGIGDALLSGGNVLQGAFEGILHIMGRFLVQLGEAAVLQSSLAIAIKNAFKAPTLGLVAGIAAIALGTVLSSIKLPAFAGGVDNFRGGLAVVGERGPELVNLPRGSDVIPNHRLNGMAGSDGMQVFIPETRIAGADIVISYNRASSKNSRNGF